jgi:hypothetical protein
MDTKLQRRTTPGASVDASESGYRFFIPPGDNRHYRLSQLDDYAQFTRRYYPHRPTLRLSLRARASAESHPGTWGFGLWNDPFLMTIGFKGKPLSLPALPNAVWFFQASEKSYLSFSDKPGNGFLAQAFRSPAFPFGRLAQAVLAFPFSRSSARKLVGNVVEEDGIRLSVDPTGWHGYRLEWSPTRSAFWVDETLIFETPVSPRPPLGLVLWIDNMFAAWRPDGKMGFGVHGTSEPAWLEIRDLDLKGSPPTAGLEPEPPR